MYIQQTESTLPPSLPPPFNYSYRASREAWLRICLQYGICRFGPWEGKIPWSRKWQLTPVFLPGKFHRQSSSVGYSPWGPKELKQLTLEIRGQKLKAKDYWGSQYWKRQDYREKRMERKPKTPCCFPQAIRYFKLSWKRQGKAVDKRLKSWILIIVKYLETKIRNQGLHRRRNPGKHFTLLAKICEKFCPRFKNKE